MSRSMRAFGGCQNLPADGNICVVVENGDKSWLKAFSVDHERWTFCHLEPIGSTKKLLVQCVQAGSFIQCCGHGLLCAAKYWADRYTLPQFELTMNHSLIKANVVNCCVRLNFPRLDVLANRVPDWVRGLSECKPIRAAVCGPNTGYLILQWPDGFDLRCLQNVAQTLLSASERALIVTAASIDAEEDFRFRYFAPQYGNEEDSATGSAMRVLVEFWRARFDECVAYQVSASRGLFMGRLTGDGVSVEGFCEYITE